MSDATSRVMDTLSVTTAVATVAGWLPSIAALVTIIWTGIRIYETKTVQDLLGKRSLRNSRRMHKDSDDGHPLR